MRYPCGYLGDGKHPCTCTPLQIERYLGRISGPLLDRIDLHLEVPAVPFQELSAAADGTSSLAMRQQEPKPPVGVLGRAEPRKHAHRPELPPVHAGVNAPGERELARAPQIARVIERRLARL